MDINITQGGKRLPLPSADELQTLVPGIGLAVALVALVFYPMPTGNAEVVKLIAAGFLGALVNRRASSPQDTTQ